MFSSVFLRDWVTILAQWEVQLFIISILNSQTIYFYPVVYSNEIKIHKIYFELKSSFVINDIHETSEHKASIILIELTKLLFWHSLLTPLWLNK